MKSIIVCKENYEIDDDTVIYIGSHNFSENAWGIATFNDEFYTEINISNTELGLLYFPKKGSKHIKQ